MTTQVGNNAQFVAPQKGLTIIGDHAYAFSGAFGSTTSSQTMLQFTTGDGYIVGKLTMSGAVSFASVGGLKTAFQVSLNGNVIALSLFDNQTDHASSLNRLNILLPPYSTVTVECDSDDTNAGAKSTAVFVGKVYDN